MREATVTYVGHATVRIALDGTRLLTDPLLRHRVTHLRRRAPVAPDALRGVDAVLVSHAHYDHLDLPSLERLGRSVPVILPRGLGPLLRRRQFAHVVEVDAGETVSVGELSVRATAADHEGGRGPLGATGPALGFVVEGSSRIYFAGDSDLFPEMAALAEPPLDLALVPIWGWGPSLGRGKHMDPERAAEALALLRPRIAVPIHWGTYHPLHLGLRAVPAYLREPPGRFLRAAAARAPDVEVRVLRPGESLSLAPEAG
ncbi:MBL fold metallo-hydrolase [Gaiella sp.]|jgi:L-ascorbate metabolism protein UlaG (beta-lactamase superfamily)|uniref:MBL fold metallo-hydrolase n=1 Tax=Gaiella sp. TaxID=2663207 RepID=UPI002E33119F|nr:MBL fold metallo-hydrolase [Gaiella sp.]HEX5584263.1 MBL fold metallo-hydrolase [Gaiella sp.]